MLLLTVAISLVLVLETEGLFDLFSVVIYECTQMGKQPASLEIQGIYFAKMKWRSSIHLLNKSLEREKILKKLILLHVRGGDLLLKYYFSMKIQVCGNWYTEGFAAEISIISACDEANQEFQSFSCHEILLWFKIKTTS